FGPAPRSPQPADAAHRYRCRRRDPHLLPRLHGRGPRILALLRLPEPVHLLDARNRSGKQFSDAVHLLGTGRRFQLPAHRPLVRTSLRRGRLQKGFPHQSAGRLRIPPRYPDALGHGRRAEFFACRRPTETKSGIIRLDDDAGRATRFLRRGRQVGSIPAARLAARRHGRSHLTTHAFFKALLFLGAGSVIHALHHEQDIWRMGALSNRMRTTYWTFVAGAMALCGVPPLSGFFSKDEIIAAALDSEHGSLWLFILAVGVALLTTFYMSRLVLVAFLGPAKSPEAERAHESPPIMTW